ncbi:MAG: hypothetical protein ACLVF9_07385 [Enterocloster sp.]
MRFSLYGEILEFGKEIEAYVEIRKCFQIAAKELEPLKDTLRELVGLDFAECFQLLDEVRIDVLKTQLEMAVKILYRYGYEYADEEEFFEKYENMIDTFREDMEPLIEQCENIQRQFHMEQNLHQISKVSRSRWQGGGFGVKGAIKGAITAAALNAGTDVFRNARDAGKERRVEGDYVKQRDKLLGSLKTRTLIIEAMKKSAYAMAECVMAELVDLGLIMPLDLEPNKAKILLKNTLKFKNPTLEELKHVAVKCLQMDPFCQDIYECLLESDGENQEVLDLALYFGMIPQDMPSEELQKIERMEETNWKSIVEKIKAYEHWKMKFHIVVEPKKTEEMIGKLETICISHPLETETVISELKEAFKGSPYQYLKMGELEAFGIFISYLTVKERNNRSVLSALDDYIRLKQEYSGLDITTFMMKEIERLQEEEDGDGVSIQTAIACLRNKYEAIASDEQIYNYYEDILTNHLHNDVYDEKQSMLFYNEERYQRFLGFLVPELTASARWSRVLKEQDTASQLAGLTRKIARYLLKYHMGVIMHQNDNDGHEKSIILPKEYRIFLETVIEYVKGNCDSLSLGMVEEEFTPEMIVQNICGEHRTYEKQYLNVDSSIRKTGNYFLAMLNFEIPEQDDVFLMFDATFANKWTKGFALATSGLYMSQFVFFKRAVYRIDWENYKNIELERKGDEIKILGISFPAGKSARYLFELLQQIQLELREL